METTRQWAESHGISVADVVPPIEEYTEEYARTAEEVAARTIILHGVSAVGFGVDSNAVIDWFKEQHLWGRVSPREMLFLQSTDPSESDRIQTQWRNESEWALLWTIGRIESLGFPTHTCDTARLVDEIMPPLDGDVSAFISTARLRSPAELLAEDDRIYNLHCYARQDKRNGKELPADLIYSVLYERHYAFDWLRGAAEWDDITCDT